MQGYSVSHLRLDSNQQQQQQQVGAVEPQHNLFARPLAFQIKMPVPFALWF
jgi:hypothetical protein